MHSASGIASSIKLSVLNALLVVMHFMCEIEGPALRTQDDPAGAFVRPLGEGSTLTGNTRTQAFVAPAVPAKAQTIETLPKPLRRLTATTALRASITSHLTLLQDRHA